MIRFAVLGSGSSGNSYAFTDGVSTLLVDQGFSMVSLERRLSAVDIPLSTVKGLCVTHLHPDHVHGVSVFVKKTGLPVYMNVRAKEKEPVVFDRLRLPDSSLRLVEEEHDFTVGPFSLRCFPTSHDSGGSVGWRISIADHSLMLLTDSGICSEEERGEARDVEVLFLEANYDTEMLAKGPYPLALKRRIASKWGHLSNDQAVDFLLESGFHGQRVYFIHLSDTNNNPALLANTVESRYHGLFTVCEKGKSYQGCIA